MSSILLKISTVLMFLTVSFLTAQDFQGKANNLTNNTSMNTDSYNEIADSNTTSLYYIQPRLYLFSVKYNL